jgi:hypothetical protein
MWSAQISINIDAPYAGGGSASSYRRPFPFPSTVLKGRPSHGPVRHGDALCSEMGFALLGDGPGVSRTIGSNNRPVKAGHQRGVAMYRRCNWPSDLTDEMSPRPFRTSN